MPSEVGLIEITVKASPDRTYLVGYDMPSGDGRTYHVHAGDNLSAPRVPLQDWFTDDLTARTYGPWQPETAGEHRFLLTVEGDELDAPGLVLTVLDLGPNTTGVTV